MMPVSQHGDGIPEATAAEDSVQETELRAKKRQDAHRALELLEEYHSRLVSEEDQQLRRAIEQVIRIFKSCLFKALLDIQAFYEITLQNDDKSLQEKTSETLEVASRWEKRYSSTKALQNIASTSSSSSSRNENLFPRVATCVLAAKSDGAVAAEARNSPPVAQSSPLNPEVQYHQVDSSERTQSFSSATAQTPRKGNPLSEEDGGSDQVKENETWIYEELILDRGDKGFGFSISGGTDFCYIAGDPGIYVTKIMDNKAAAIDGRLRINDLIVSVNGVSLVNITHSMAVDLLRKAGNRVHMVLKRRTIGREQITLIELKKGPNGLGFSICGGIGNQNIPGDDGIFLRDIVSGGTADLDGRLSNGDRILEVNGFSLESVTHEVAVAAIKATGDSVKLLIAKPFACSFVNSEDSFPKHSTSFPSAPASEAPLSRSDESMEALPASHSHQFSTPVAAALESPCVARGQDVAQCSAQNVSIDGALSRVPRKVILRKGASGLGFNIVGGEDGTGIFISFVQDGGVADLSRGLQRGDQILAVGRAIFHVGVVYEVNGVNLCNATHEEAASVLKRSSSCVDMMVIYNPEEYNCFETKIHELSQQLMNNNLGHLKMTEKRSLYVRALFDYDPMKDSDLPGRGLSFHYGDILHVTNASDEEWWQAYRLVPRSDNGFGIIPSKSRVERKERSRLRSVTFSNKEADAKGKSQTFPREMKKKTLFTRKLSLTKNKEKNDSQPASVSSDSVGEETIPPSYEPVVQRELQYPRPLIILGPLKDQINDGLVSEYPERFGVCVPLKKNFLTDNHSDMFHLGFALQNRLCVTILDNTTRPMRAGEVDGRDYHFVSSREQMERDIETNQFIEAGQYNGNLYGTHLKSVIEVAEQGRHCILDVSIKAVLSLQAANLYPIAILVKALAPQVIMLWNKQFTEDEARKSYEQTLKLEQEFGEHFTAIISGSNIDEIYDTVRDVIFDQSGTVVWLSIGKRDSF